MKTLQELYNEVMNSDALKTEFLALTTPEQVVAFAEKNGCPATLEEIKSFFEEHSAAAGELSDEELAQVAGGKSATKQEAILSACTLGAYCVYRAQFSYMNGKCGTDIQGEGMLCELKKKEEKKVEAGEVRW